MGQDKLIKLFREAKYESDTDLADNVWYSIITHEKHTTQIKSWIFAFVGFASLIGFIPMFKILSSDLTKSGFYEYLSLIFSDSSSILFYFKEFAFSLAESLPITSMILSLGLIFIFFLSTKYTVKQIIRSQLIF